MNPRRLALVTLSLAGVAGRAGTMAGRWLRSSPNPYPAVQLVIEPGELDIGVQFESAAYIHTFHLHNPSDVPVSVTQMRSSCDCTNLSPTTGFAIAPHGSQEVQAVLSLRMQSDCQRIRGNGEPTRIQFRVLYTIGEGTSCEQAFELVTVVRPAFRLARGSLALGLQSVRQPGFTRVIEVEAAAEVKRIECQLHPNWTVDVPANALGSGRPFPVTLRLIGPVIPRVIDDRLRIIPFDGAGRKLPESELRITGEFAEDIQAWPRTLSFGRLPLGSPAEETVQLRSLSSSPFTVAGIETSGRSNTVVRLNGPGDPSFRIAFHADGEGEQTTSVGFQIVDDQGRRSIVTLPIRYHGLRE